MEGVSADLVVLGVLGERLFDVDGAFRMIVFVVLALALQATPKALPPQQSLVSETSPAYDFQCELQDSSATTYRLGLVQSGGRAFRDLNSDNPTWIRRTEFDTKVTTDETKMFSGYGGNQPFFDRNRQDQFAVITDGRIPVAQASVWLFEGKQSKFAIVISKTWPVFFADYVGFCNVTRTPQQPLNAKETKGYLNK